MGFKWGSIIPLADKDCIPKPSECCCETNQLDIQKVRSCRKKSACPTFDQGIQYQKCLAPNELPLVAGNYSGEVCGVSPGIFCDIQAKLGPVATSLSSTLKNVVAYPVMFASALIMISGLSKLQQQSTSKNGSCCGLDADSWSNMGNACGTCSICVAFVVLIMMGIGYSILWEVNNDNANLCDGKKWNDASTQCVSQCKASISEVMNHYACPVSENIQSLKLVMNILCWGGLMATLFICLGYCTHTRKRPRKPYVPLRSGGTVSAPGEVARSGGQNMQYMPPVAQVVIAQPQTVAQPQPVAQPLPAVAKQ